MSSLSTVVASPDIGSYNMEVKAFNLNSFFIIVLRYVAVINVNISDRLVKLVEGSWNFL